MTLRSLASTNFVNRVLTTVVGVTRVLTTVIGVTRVLTTVVGVTRTIFCNVVHPHVLIQEMLHPFWWTFGCDTVFVRHALLTRGARSERYIVVVRPSCHFLVATRLRESRVLSLFVFIITSLLSERVTAADQLCDSVACSLASAYQCFQATYRLYLQHLFPRFGRNDNILECCGPRKKLLELYRPAKGIRAVTPTKVTVEWWFSNWDSFSPHWVSVWRRIVFCKTF
jgi:hypothetical protein